MSELVCEALATKAELQELRDQINQLLGQKEDGSGINDVLQLGTLAGTVVSAGLVTNIDFVLDKANQVKMFLVNGHGSKTRLTQGSKVLTQMSTKTAIATKGVATMAANIINAVGLATTGLNYYVNQLQTDILGMTIDNADRAEISRNIDFNNVINIISRQQGDYQQAIAQSEQEVIEYQGKINKAVEDREVIAYRYQLALENINKLEDRNDNQVGLIVRSFEFIDSLKDELEAYQESADTEIQELKSTIEELEEQLQQNYDDLISSDDNPYKQISEQLAERLTDYQAKLTELEDKYSKQQITSSVILAELLNLKIAEENETDEETDFQTLGGKIISRSGGGGGTSSATRKAISNQQNKTLELINTLAGNPITDLPNIQPWEFDNSDNPFNDLFSQLLPQVKPQTGTGGDVNVDVDELSTRLKDDFSNTLTNTLTTLGIVGITTTVNDIYSQTSPSNIASTVSNAVEDTVCDISSPGKCLNTNIADPIKQGQNLIKQGQDNLTNLLNTALQVGDLAQGQAILNTVTNTNNFLKGAWNSTVIDKTLNAANFALSLHNAMMLSNNIAETVLDTVSAVLETVGISDAEGNPIDVADWLTSKITQVIQGIIGAQTFTELSLKLTAANRIYQAGMNILDNVTDLMDTAMDLDQYTGENIARIGNALRQSGVVPYDAYDQMIEDLDVRGRSKWLFKLEQAEDAVDNLYSIADSIRDIKEIGQELKESRNEFQETLQTEKTTLSDTEIKLEAEIESNPEPTEQDEVRG